MQIFVTGTAYQTALDLDRKRLSNQITEARIIFDCLMGKNKWGRHPLIKMETDAQAVLEQKKREAEAEAYMAEMKAKAVKAKADADKYAALQEAEGIEAKGKAEAAAKQAVLEAEAEGIRAKGDAEAEAMDKKAEAYKRSDFARLEMVLEMQKIVLPQVAENVAKPMSQIGEVTIYGQTGGEVAGVSQNVPVVMQRTFDIVKQTTGVDVADILKAETIDAKVTKNVNVNGDVRMADQ